MRQCETNARIRILMAAKKLFAQQGFEATTVRQICKEAKTNLALVSYHFGGKESVFFDLFDMFFPNDRCCPSDVSIDPVIGIRLIIEKLINFKIEQPEMVSIMQQEVLMNSPRLEEMSKYVYPVYKRLKEMLEMGQRQGIFYFKSIDNTMLFVMSIVTFPQNNTFINPLLTSEKQEVNDLLTDTLKFVFDGLGYVDRTRHKSII